MFSIAFRRFDLIRRVSIEHENIGEDVAGEPVHC